MHFCERSGSANTIASLIIRYYQSILLMLSQAYSSVRAVTMKSKMVLLNNFKSLSTVAVLETNVEVSRQQSFTNSLGWAATRSVKAKAKTLRKCR